MDADKTSTRWSMSRHGFFFFFNVVSSLSLVIVFARTVYFTFLLAGGFETSDGLEHYACYRQGSLSYCWTMIEFFGAHSSSQVMPAHSKHSDSALSSSSCLRDVHRVLICIRCSQFCLPGTRSCGVHWVTWPCSGSNMTLHSAWHHPFNICIWRHIKGHLYCVWENHTYRRCPRRIKGECVNPANLIQFCQFISCYLAKEPGFPLIITVLLIADAPLCAGVLGLLWQSAAAGETEKSHSTGDSSPTSRCQQSWSFLSTLAFSHRWRSLSGSP
jgi:hypothetical protein